MPIALSLGLEIDIYLIAVFRLVEIAFTLWYLGGSVGHLLQKLVGVVSLFLQKL